MEFTIDNLQVLITAKKYFDNEVSEADSPLFPDVDTVSNNLVCSFLEGDRRRKYGNKIPVTLTNQIMDEFSLHIKNIVKKKPNKPEICFLIYMLQNIAIKQPAQERAVAQGEQPARLAAGPSRPAAPAAGLEGLPVLAPLRTKKKGGAPPVENSIYTRILDNNKINLEKISKKGKELCQDLTRAIYSKNYDKFLKALEEYVDLPKDSAKEKLEEIERILSKLPADFNEYSQIKIVDLFTIRNEDLRIDINSVYYKLGTYGQEHKIITNLVNFLESKKVTINVVNYSDVNYSDTDKIRKTLLELDPNHCTLLSQDDPNIPYDPSVPPEQNMTRLFKDYNLTEIDKFVNINNGYCFTQEYLTAMLIAYRGSLTHAEVSLAPRGNKLTELVEKLAVYYTSGTEEEKLEKLEKQKDDIIDGLALYSIKELEYIIKHFGEPCPIIFKDIHKKINELKDKEEQKNFKFVAECKNLLKEPINKEDLTKFFTFMLSGGLKDAANMDKVKAIYNYSCNTIFELIGLAGYTLFSDMITQVHNVDGNMFSISTYCIAQMEHLRQELEKIKIGKDDKDNLADALNKIKFGSDANEISYEGILKSAETQCIHGVGRRCLDYYLRAYEAMQGFAQTLKPVPPPAPAQAGGIKPIPDEILASEEAANEAIEKMFALAPYLVRVPLDIERSTSIRYLTCFAHDDDSYSERNPNNHCYVISGFTTDLKFVHVLHAKYNNYRTLVDNNNTYLSIKDSFNIISSDVYYTITPHNGITHIAEYREKANILAGYYNDPKNIMEFNKLLRIPYTFHRHRKATFKAFKDYTLHICKLMAEEYKPANPPANPVDNTKKYTALRTFTTDYKLTDYITMDELPLLPKHMTFLDLTEANPNHPNKKYKPENENKNVSKKMWNTEFDVPDLDINNRDFQEYLNKNYYIDTLENFLSLGYNQELIEDEKIAIIKTPETRKNVTRSYQFAQLLGKILCNNNFNRIMVPIEESYKYFNNYFLNAAGQVSSFIDAPFKDINFFIVRKGKRENINKSNAMIYTRGNENTPDIKIIAACIQNINTFSAIGYHAKYIDGEYFTNLGKDNKEAVKRITSFFEDEVDRRMELIFTLFKIFFVIIPPNADNDTYFMKIREYIRIKSSTTFNTRNYKTMFQSIIDIMCSEGNMQSGYKYHFTELDKEFYLLKEIHKEFQSATAAELIPSTSISTKNDDCINIMIGILNTKFAYFNPSDQDTDVQLVTDTNNIEYIQDAKSLAIEYINKTELISMHALRMYVFWIFERIVIKLSSMEYYYGADFGKLENNEEGTDKYIKAQSNIETKFLGIFDFEYDEIGIHSMLRELKTATPDKLVRFLDIMQDEVI